MGILRVYLALCVVLNHVKAGWLPFIPGSVFAVQTFFVISGFYISMVWIEKYQSLTNGRLAFWTNRWLRLAPAYILVSAATVIFTLQKAGSFRGIQEPSIEAMVASILSNIFLVGQDLFSFVNYNILSGHFEFVVDSLGSATQLDTTKVLPGWYFQPIGPGWSIGIEIWFYLLAPFIVALRLRWLVLVFSLGCLVTNIIPLFSHADQWNYRFFPGQIMYFVVGIFAYRIYATFKDRWPMEKFGWNLVFLFIPLTSLFSSSFSLRMPYFFNLAISYLFLVALIFLIPFVFAASKKSQWDQKLGLLSYPLYIVHMPLFEYFADGSTFARLGLSIVASILLVILVEMPIEGLRIKLVRRHQSVKNESLPAPAVLS